MARTTIRKPTLERREEIALAALAILGEQGLAGLTMAVLAKRVGVTSGALFRHFVSRDAILEEAVRLAATRVEATFPDPSRPALDRLRDLAHARVGLLCEQPVVAWLLRSAQARAGLPASAVRRLQGLVRRSRGVIRTAIHEAREAGQIRSDVPVDVLLLTYTAVVHALVREPGKPGRSASARTRKAAVEGLLVMLAPAKSKN